MSMITRIQQAMFYARSGKNPIIPAEAEALLLPDMAPQFHMLPAPDQRHLVAVWTRLHADGADPDTITAGLIHDVGKACRKCRQIGVVTRTAHVLLSRMAYRSYAAWARRDHVPDRLRPLRRLAIHAERGAWSAEQAGYSARVCDLIRYHERGGDPHDAQLQLLRRVDRTTRG